MAGSAGSPPRCEFCGRVRATEEDWLDLSDGEGAELCWRPWSVDECETAQADGCRPGHYARPVR
jgi:hypothetical protein